MPDIINFKPSAKEKDELVPMEEWDGECWKTMFDTLARLAPQADPWDLLAAFIKKTLMNGGDSHE